MFDSQEIERLIQLNKQSLSQLYKEKESIDFKIDYLENVIKLLESKLEEYCGR